jgi:cell division protein FtsW
VALISIGVWVSIASTPAVAIKLGLPPFYFVRHHLLIIPISISIMVAISFLQSSDIRKIAAIGYVFCIVSLICVAFFGLEIKGAKRWINIFGFSLQPSEFLKPTLAVITAWLVSEQYMDRGFPGIILSAASLFLVAPFLLLQPDVGMTIVIVLTWIAQLFISGISVLMLSLFAIFAALSLWGLYFVFPHFAGRLNMFIGDEGDLYQVKKSLEAFRSGGFFGKGPGEGIVKTLVPDAHADFVFSVIGEEFGFLLCVLIIILFIILIIRALTKVMKSYNIFDLTVVFGIVFQVTIQIVINLATSLNLIPTKGMTLPFISYGGSSFLVTSISFGIVLAITKKSTNRAK